MGALDRVHQPRPCGLAAGLLAACAALALWAAPAAVADTTVLGEQNLVPNSANSDLTGQGIPVFQGDAGPGYVLSSPRTGTITSWSFLSAGIATGKQFELAVLAPTDATGTNWRLLATSAPVAVTTMTGVDGVNGPFPAQIPIDAGDRIALLPFDDSNSPVEAGTPNVDGIRYFAQPFAGAGSSQSVASTADYGQVVPIQATLTFVGQQLPPQNTKLPSISGIVRQFETLTADPGRWQNGVTKFTDSWLRCGLDGNGCVAIPGATSTTYVPTRDDVGFTLRFQVVAGNDGGDSPSTLSAATAIVQRGVVTARLTVSPNPTCTGIPTRLDGSASVSPDGIKSYSFSFIDLYAAAEHTASLNGGTIDTEAAAEFGAGLEALVLESGGADANYLINNFDGRPLVTTKPTVSETLDWNRPAIFNPNDPLGPGPYDLARDDVGVLLVVTDYAGATSRAVAILDFAQTVSSASRTRCPNTRRFLVSPNAVLAASVIFQAAAAQPSTTASCRTSVACVGSITVSARTCKACAKVAARRQSPILAAAFFNVPPHRTRKVVLKLTPLGKRLLHRGARVAVRVTIVSATPTGRSVRHTYSLTLRR